MENFTGDAPIERQFLRFNQLAPWKDVDTTEDQIQIDRERQTLNILESAEDLENNQGRQFKTQTFMS